ncbi:MAG: hypothetical protein HeimC3_08140 [Candidatus Heimdallarchaeota archaeon LC_3]|nr:MAG: hypothetical protein HeimC3_08140 [Candidatus Heimdallarchaeota archaeon LC_3]
MFGLRFMVFPAIIILHLLFFFKSFPKFNLGESRSLFNKTNNRENSFNSQASSKIVNKISYSSNESIFSPGRCPNCGAAVEKKEKNCYNCGVRLYH